MRTAPSPARSERPGYEIFHDVLAVPIQTWLARFKQSVALVQDYKGQIIALAVATLVALFALASVGFGVWATLERNRAEQQLAEAQASLIWSRLEFRSNYTLEEYEVDALWALTTSGGDVQWAFWHQLIENQGHVFKLRA